MCAEKQEKNPNIFDGAAIHDSFPNQRASGTITVSSYGIDFNCEHGEVLLPLTDLQISLGGSNDALIFFAHPSHPEWSIYTRDKSILKHQCFVRDEAHRTQIQKVKKKKLFGVAVLWGLLIVFLAMLFGLYLLKDVMVRSVAKQIPVSWEQKLGDTVFESLKYQSNIIEDPAIKQQFAIMTKALMKGIDDQRYEFKFYIVNNPEPNAFALPGGNVVIYSGLILQSKEPEEVVGVMAHEIAHVTQQHGLQNIISAAGYMAIIQGMLGDISGISAELLDAGAFLANMKFSRDFERQADDKGWAYLLKAGVNPIGMKNFFEKIRDLKKSKVEETYDKTLNILSTHPPTEERIQTMEEKCSKIKNRKFEKINIDFKAFQNKIREKSQ